MTQSNGPAGPINHVFVLMLENRAFDHILGFSGLEGTDAGTGQPTQLEGVGANQYFNVDPTNPGTQVFAQTPADLKIWWPGVDPGHLFKDTLMQLCGSQFDENGNLFPPPYPDPNTGGYPPISNAGFIANYRSHFATNPAKIMNCFGSEQVPVLVALAQSFAVCDQWFSSIPGPTWPNRFFLHAASSASVCSGYWNDVTLQTDNPILSDGYVFPNGTIYDRLDQAGLDWIVFHGDELPQVFAIRGMLDRLDHFHNFGDLVNVVNDANFSTAYVFIEPNYGYILERTPQDSTCGNSQHPLDDITRGEALIKQVYETLRNSPHWNDSMLVVTYDEHGGFYDHVAPPPTVNPGDGVSNPNNNPEQFDFTQLGVRVPAVIVSPWIPANTIDHTIYDHASLPATLESLFGLAALTNRDRQANTLTHLLSLQAPRADAPMLLPDPHPQDPALQCPGDPAAKTGGGLIPLERYRRDGPIETILQDFLHVAFLRDYHQASRASKAALKRKFLKINSRFEALHYMQDVSRKIQRRRPRVVKHRRRIGPKQLRRKRRGR